MVHNVILDFGNVLGTFDKQSACAQLAAYSKMRGTEIYDRIVGSELETSLESGCIDNSTFADKLIALVSAESLTREKCLEIWGDIFETNPGMTDLLHNLHQRRISMAVLSTTNAVHWPYIRKIDTIQLLEKWQTPFILSHLEGAVKPEPRLYKSALSALHCVAKEAVVVDDISENVAVAKELGFFGIEYDCRKQPLDYLRGSLDKILM